MIRKGIAAAILAMAIAFLVMGSIATHDVLLVNAEEIAVEFDLPPPFQPIGELQLVVDTTFSGVVLKDGKLRSTYDRTKPLAVKRACPT